MIVRLDGTIAEGSVDQKNRDNNQGEQDRAIQDFFATADQYRKFGGHRHGEGHHDDSGERQQPLQEIQHLVDDCSDHALVVTNDLSRNGKHNGGCGIREA